jgi:hypothetical protein
MPKRDSYIGVLFLNHTNLSFPSNQKSSVMSFFREKMQHTEMLK